MQKTVRHPQVHFPPETLEAAMRKASELVVEKMAASGSYYYEPGMSSSTKLIRLEVGGVNHTWTTETLEEHLTELANAKRDGVFQFARTALMISCVFFDVTIAVDEDLYETRVSISSSERDFIRLLHGVFEDAAPNSRTEDTPPPAVKPRVFIGHGRDPAWRELAMALHHEYDLETVHYESGSRAGHAIRDILDQMTDEAGFAIIVMTAEDEVVTGEGQDPAFRARQNVVHEAGLFQGKLGFTRTIVLRQSNVEMFSNIDGIQYVAFEHSIRAALGDVLGALRREFGPI